MTFKGDISWIKGGNSQLLQLDIDAYSKNEQGGTHSLPKANEMLSQAWESTTDSPD